MAGREPGRRPRGSARFLAPRRLPRPCSARSLGAWLASPGDRTGGTRTVDTVPSRLYTTTEASSPSSSPSPRRVWEVSAPSPLGSRARSPSSGGGHASPCVIAARRAALLDAMAPCVADDLAPRRGGLVPSPSNGARASGLRLDGVGREASWLTTRRSYGVTGLSGEANGCFRELEVARTASMAAGSMGAALPEPSCGIDPTSPGLDEQLPITRPVKTGPGPRKRSACRGTSGVPERTGGSTPRAARGVARAEARLARCPTKAQRPSPRARAAVCSSARAFALRCPLLNGKVERQAASAMSA